MELMQDVVVEGARSWYCLVTVFQTLLIAIVSAALSVFIDYLLEEHPLGKYYAGILTRMPPNLAKPLGECIFCSGAWLYLATAFFVVKIPLLICFLGLGINHLAILVLLYKSRYWTKNL
jgi:hypothetical protein